MPTKTTPAVTTSRVTSAAEWLVDEHRLSTTSDRSIDAEWRERRQHNAAERKRLVAGHRGHYAVMLSQSSAQLAKMSVRDLLDGLSSRHGLSWIDISRMLGVSVPTLRKWRKDVNGASGDNHKRLASLVAFVRLIEEVGAVDSAGRWLVVPFDSDYTVTPRDLYSPETAPLLIDHVVGGGSFASLVEEVAPGSLETWRRNFEVVTAEDGSPSLISKTPTATEA